jgi:hypothetical protein
LNLGGSGELYFPSRTGCSTCRVAAFAPRRLRLDGPRYRVAEIHPQPVCVKWVLAAALAAVLKGEAFGRGSPGGGSLAKVPLAVPLPSFPWRFPGDGPLEGGPLAEGSPGGGSLAKVPLEEVLGEAFLVRGLPTTGVSQSGPCNYGSNTPTIGFCVKDTSEEVHLRRFPWRWCLCKGSRTRALPQKLEACNEIFARHISLERCCCCQS